MKNWKTTLFGLIGAATILATSKGWIDQEIAAFIGAVVVAFLGINAKDYNVSGTDDLIGGRPDDRK